MADGFLSDTSRFGTDQRGAGRSGDGALIAELNDLLQLDRDAIAAYTVAIAALRDESLRDALRSYRADHERHVQELESLIRAFGGVPGQWLHLPTGLFKALVQASGGFGGDRGILLAYRANERQVCLKYLRHASGNHPPDVTELLRRNYQDEKRHYDWVEEMLEALGAGPGSMVGGLTDAFAVFHGANADMIEAVQRMGLEAVEQFRRRT